MFLHLSVEQEEKRNWWFVKPEGGRLPPRLLLLPRQMKHGLHDVGSVLGARFTEQGTVCLRAKQRHTWLQPLYLHTWELWRLYKHVTVSWSGQLHTFANFSPCARLTQRPSGSCSRRSTLFPITHMGIFSSAASFSKAKAHCSFEIPE